MTKTKVAVLRGGQSSEYEISLKNGASVLNNLSNEKYDATDIFVDKNGEWYVGGIQKKPEVALADIDVVWNALTPNDDVQKIFDDVSLPYTGSSFSMNKVLTKKALAGYGIKMPYHIELSKNDWQIKMPDEIFRTAPNPSVIKNVSSDFSIDTTIVRDFFDLQNALEKTFAVSDSIMIEEYIDGREATCGVIENFRGKDLYALPTAEGEICPSNFSRDVKDEIEHLAVLIHKTLGLSHYSRSDFIVHPKRGIYFLETDVLPEITEESLMLKSIEAVGSSLPEFLDHIITIAINEK